MCGKIRKCCPNGVVKTPKKTYSPFVVKYRLTPNRNGGHTMTEMQHLIEEEVFAIRQSGEMPEVALHTALYYLQEDSEGPRATLSPENLRLLKDAVENRYQRILMRDLNPRYRGRSIYRGLNRAIANWERLVRFCERENRPIAGHRQDAAVALLAFLTIETAEVASGQKASSVNCSASELKAFAEALGLASTRLPDGWSMVCI